MATDAIGNHGGIAMYAVIRTGGKQYRVAPGDVIRIESRASADSNLEFSDVLAVSGGDGQIGRPPSDARVLGHVVEQGRGDKLLVFHYKRMKQYTQRTRLQHPTSGLQSVRRASRPRRDDHCAAAGDASEARPQRWAWQRRHAIRQDFRPNQVHGQRLHGQVRNDRATGSELADDYHRAHLGMRPAASPSGWGFFI